MSRINEYNMLNDILGVRFRTHQTIEDAISLNFGKFVYVQYVLNAGSYANYTLSVRLFIGINVILF